ncbi:unnamed protein product [Adineta ricciae]|uniref:Methyltransferase FkbM domain-containing protein n=2 Tax=Adineta ricciae TaxID=249248 RepID=A0A815LGC1_ADIRI|nr:unnamed protein product [Adineta ricciae]
MNRSGQLTITSIIIIIGFAVFYVNYTIHGGLKVFSNTVAKNRVGFGGFGAGVVVVEGNKKDFVTMVQRTMFTLNTQGYIPMPDTIKRVWIDVGSHAGTFLAGDSVYSAVYWPSRTSKNLRDEFREATDIMTIAIDPNARFYDGLSKIPRVVAIIAAVYTGAGTQLFYEYPVDGCSSLLEPNAELDVSYFAGKWLTGCHQVKQMTGVSTVRLETILSLIDPRLDIQLLKIDAQGADLEVAQSGGEQLKRVGKIIIETQKKVSTNNKTSNMLYKNQVSAAHSVKWMADNGFIFDEKQSFANNEEIKEYNYVFNNRYRNDTS